ncbi:2-dehydropantoate 2-reductase [Sphingomonas arenae]|uniref:2-dehydropantoate 2-reductase n=1 Tax=Sphingomonas arenae TaxID=2812555 RepID=UPI00196845AD|nr:2-dehydropantoate 2-reductase [Sphingomonas arenae]
MSDTLHIVVAGAGSIGCFVGGLLSAGGRRVTLLARPRIADELEQHGLHLTSLEGWTADPSPAVSVDPAVLGTADLVLVTVKSGATEEMARLIAAHAPASAVVVSLQNGVSNADRLRTLLPGRTVLAGMVSFNVLHRGEGRFHRGTSGPLIVEAGEERVIDALRVPRLDVQNAPDMGGVQWGKLLLNLNNALNALSGLPLRHQLLDRRWRRVLAAQQEEGLALLAEAGIRPWSMGPIPARRFPQLLRLPTPLFRALARSAVRIDPLARSSMWEDLERGRTTEVGELQGAIVALAERLGRDAPVNGRVLAEVRKAEAAGRGSPRLDPTTLLGP